MDTSSCDRRVHGRKSCMISVDYQIGGRIYRDFARNISTGGLLIETAGKFIVGQDVSLTFIEPSFGKQMKTMAQIVWIDPNRMGLRLKANSREVRKVGKVKRKRLVWERSLSEKVTKYRVYWSNDGAADYDSDYAEAGDVAQIILPDDIPSFPLVADEMEVGVSAVSEAGNESEIARITVSFDFTVPEPPRNLKLEDL
jgi:Tfp pilus assembly protein PilZ